MRYPHNLNLNLQNILILKPERKRIFGKPRHGWENMILGGVTISKV